MLVMRWQLAWPTAPLPPALATAVGETNARGGSMVSEFYNQLVAMHGTVMIDRQDGDAADDIGLLNVLTVPVGRPVLVDLPSRDVVHSFSLNGMRVKQDATPGLTVRTWFTPTLTGKWEIGCSQLCGLGHYRMRGDFAVLTEEAWQRWLAREIALIARGLQP